MSLIFMKESYVVLFYKTSVCPGIKNFLYYSQKGWSSIVTKMAKNFLVWLNNIDLGVYQNVRRANNEFLKLGENMILVD